MRRIALFSVSVAIVILLRRAQSLEGRSYPLSCVRFEPRVGMTYHLITKLKLILFIQKVK